MYLTLKQLTDLVKLDSSHFWIKGGILFPEYLQVLQHFLTFGLLLVEPN